MTHLLFIAGSTRTQSLNKQLALYAMKLANDAGVKTSFVDLKALALPLYDGDLEDQHGLPENAKMMKQLFVKADGFFIASPEYNGSFSAVLKNAIDWISRSEPDEAPLVAFKGKIGAISAVSPGALGGIRGLVPLRLLLSNIGVRVEPAQAAINHGGDAFDDAGCLKNPAQDKMLKALMNDLITHCAAS
ncbi:MAG: NADPH-dependent FMN reductase [Alphaproteobacteria bacterium]